MECHLQATGQCGHVERAVRELSETVHEAAVLPPCVDKSRIGEILEREKEGLEPNCAVLDKPGDKIQVVELGPYLQEFVDGAFAHILNMSTAWYSARKQLEEGDRAKELVSARISEGNEESLYSFAHIIQFLRKSGQVRTHMDAILFENAIFDAEFSCESMAYLPDIEHNLVEQGLVIGQEFADVHTCRRAIKDMAIAMHFELRVVKSDRSQFIAKCAREGCPWRVHVAKCHGVPTFTVRTLHGEHTCDGVQDLHHQQATVGWVARSVEATLRDNPQYKPKEILQDIREQHGVAVSYMQAWRGKERSMAAVHGTLEDGYRFLPAYYEQIVKTNLGSVAIYKGTGPDNSFQRPFVSFHASIHGFLNACRPLLEIDMADLKGKYLGTLLCASAVDADHMMFPLAFGIVDAESDENWMWFFSELRKMLGVNTDKMPVLTKLSERQPQVVEAVEVNFPTAFHGFCLRYVSENFRDEFKNPKLLNIFWSAVYALTTAEFDSKVNDMVQVQDVMPWFQRFPPNLWAVSYFEGIRYDHFSLGVHIADVSYFVQPETALDAKAQIQSTSVYTLRHKISMFPSRLSEDLVSLNPGVNKLAFLTIWDIAPQGNIVNIWISRSVIFLCCMLPYDIVQDLNCSDGTKFISAPLQVHGISGPEDVSSPLATGRLIAENGILKAVWPHSGSTIGCQGQLLVLAHLCKESLSLTSLALLDEPFKYGIVCGRIREDTIERHFVKHTEGEVGVTNIVTEVIDGVVHGEFGYQTSV
ncbi:hypothetical protein ABZP36_004121 [Zizania latifolia]